MEMGQARSQPSSAVRSHIQGNIRCQEFESVVEFRLDSIFGLQIEYNTNPGLLHLHLDVKMTEK
jgi:hypothetical protein